MKKQFLAIAASGLLAVYPLSAPASLISLEDYAFNIDGLLSSPGLGDALPSSVNLSRFSTVTGLGDILITVAGSGGHFAGVYLDLDIKADVDGYLDEYGAENGVPTGSAAWEIDEPGYLFGDILNHFEAGTLDSMNAVPKDGETDVAFAMGWGFSLANYETATLRFTVGDVAPSSGFYLSQTDEDEESDDFTVYLSSFLEITGDPAVPDQGMTLGLLVGSLLMLAGLRASQFSVQL